MGGLTACFVDLDDPRTGYAGRHDLLLIADYRTVYAVRRWRPSRYGQR
jgi:hypothetical protein